MATSSSSGGGADADAATTPQHFDPSAPLGRAWPHAHLRVFPSALPPQGVAAVLEEARPLAAQRDNWWVPRSALDAGPAAARTAAEAAVAHLWHTVVRPALRSDPGMEAAERCSAGGGGAGVEKAGEEEQEQGGGRRAPRRRPLPPPDRRVAGAEYWCQLYRPGAGLAFHFDKDEARLVRDGAMRHPLLSSVLYLTGGPALPPTPQPADAAAGNGGGGNSGADAAGAAGTQHPPPPPLPPARWREQGPTVVLEQLFDAEEGRPAPDAPRRGALIFPRRGGYCLFDGRLGHGVLDSFDRSAPRATLLVNFWMAADSEEEEEDEEEKEGGGGDEAAAAGSGGEKGRRASENGGAEGEEPAAEDKGEDDEEEAAAAQAQARRLLRGLAAATAPGAPLGVRRPAMEELLAAGLPAIEPPGEAEAERAWPWAAASVRLAAEAAAEEEAEGEQEQQPAPAPPYSPHRPSLPRAARLAIASLLPPPGAERCPQTADDMMAAAGVALGGGPPPPLMLRGGLMGAGRPMSPSAGAAVAGAAAFEHDGSWVLMPLDVEAGGGGELQCAAVFLPAEMIEEEEDEEEEGEDEEGDEDEEDEDGGGGRGRRGRYERY
jgi:hypothetical protein